MMGRKLDGVLVSPFLFISIVQAFFHSDGMVPGVCSSSFKYEGHWSKYKALKIA